MLAPVLSQPSLPLDDPAGLEIAPDEIAAVRERLEREDLTVLAYRFEGDRFCRAAAIRGLRRGARRALHRASASRQRRQPRHAAVLRARRAQARTAW